MNLAYIFSEYPLKILTFFEYVQILSNISLSDGHDAYQTNNLVFVIDDANIVVALASHLNVALEPCSIDCFHAYKCIFRISNTFKETF
jgi:hypothetical protein